MGCFSIPLLVCNYLFFLVCFCQSPPQQQQSLQWSSLSSGVVGLPELNVLFFHSQNNTMYYGGNFISLLDSGTTANYIASWNGNNWDNLQGGITCGTISAGITCGIFALAFDYYRNELIVGGSFVMVGYNSINA